MYYADVETLPCGRDFAHKKIVGHPIKSLTFEKWGPATRDVTTAHRVE